MAHNPDSVHHILIAQQVSVVLCSAWEKQTLRYFIVNELIHIRKDPYHVYGHHCKERKTEFQDYFFGNRIDLAVFP